MSPALAVGFFSAEPPGKPHQVNSQTYYGQKLFEVKKEWYLKIKSHIMGCGWVSGGKKGENSETDLSTKSQMLVRLERIQILRKL